MNSGEVHSSLGWLDDSGIRVVAIIGISKNAGKTSMLNHLLSRPQEKTCGVFSTGIDGEETDAIFQTRKPQVFLPKRSIFCCDTANADALGSSISLLEKLDFDSVFRPLWLARAEHELQTEITGPASVSEQLIVCKRMMELGVNRVFIDGSLDRKSISLSQDVKAVIVLIGASFGNTHSIVGEVKRLQILNKLPQSDTQHHPFLDTGRVCIFKQRTWEQTQLDSLIGTEKSFGEIVQNEPESLFIPGAITDDVFTKIKQMLSSYKGRLILRHPDCLKLSLSRLEQFLALVDTEVLIPFNIKSYVLNSEAVGSSSLDADEFRYALRKSFPELTFQDIRELI